MVNATVPAGVPPAGATAATVAVNVTAWPNTDGLTEESTVVVESALLTVWMTAADVLLLKLLSPRYSAVIEWLLTLSDEVVNRATPPLSALVVNAVALSRNTTLPVGL